MSADNHPDDKPWTGLLLDPKEHARILREALEAGKDPHKAFAAHLLGIPYEDVPPEYRNRAKAFNFYLLYNPDFMASVKWPGGVQRHLH